ncbi:MAG: acetyl-CoA C-acyltransferase [Terriglobales bacterium]
MAAPAGGAAVIVAAVRTPVGRAFKGSLAHTRPDDLAALVLREALRRANYPAEAVEDVVLGCAMPEAEQGMNVARIAALRAELPVSVAAMTVNRFCASGLEAIAHASERIGAGGGDAALAGGAESMSLIPMGGHKVSVNPWLQEHRPDSYLSMGLTAERVAAKYGVSREAADAFALASHQKAVAAIAAGHFIEETIPVPTRVPDAAAPGGWREMTLERDEGPRADTSLAALAALKPAFQIHGQVTAGNSSQMSDGAAAVLLLSEAEAARRGLQPLGRLLAYATAGVDPALMGIGPVAAIPKALARAGLKLADIGVIELNEAFAAQSLAVIAQAGLDPTRVNVNGGAIALGHPLGCTGAKLTASLLAELARRRARYGMVTMCVGGGMGAAGIFENFRR